MKIVISGTPGTGKSTIARIIADDLQYKLIGINEFAKDHKLIIGKDYIRNADVIDHRKLVTEMMKVRESCVIEGHIAHFIKADIVFVLRCNPGVLRKRLLERKWPESKIQENIDAENLEVILAEARKKNKNVYEVDATNIPEAAEAILEIIYHL